MIQGKLIPIDNIIERAYRATTKNEIDWNDAVEWIGDCLDLIGVPDQYVTKITNGGKDMPDPIPVIDYRAELPYDFISLTGIRDFDSKTVLRQATDIFIQNPNSLEQEFTFKINANFIFTGFEKGSLEIIYKAFPIDNRGFPLIPDNTKYRLALQNYVAAQIAKQEWIKDPNSAGKRAIYNDFDTEANWYIGGAQTLGLMPDLTYMETLKNNYLRSIIKVNQYETGFKYMATSEQRRIK